MVTGLLGYKFTDATGLSMDRGQLCQHIPISKDISEETRATLKHQLQTAVVEKLLQELSCQWWEWTGKKAEATNLVISVCEIPSCESAALVLSLSLA